MRILHIRYLLLIFLLSFSALASADDKKENSGTDLLIISSYVSGAPWSQTIISHIMQKEYEPERYKYESGIYEYSDNRDS